MVEKQFIDIGRESVIICTQWRFTCSNIGPSEIGSDEVSARQGRELRDFYAQSVTTLLAMQWHS